MLRKVVTTSALLASLAFAAPAMAGDFTLMKPHTGDRAKTLELHAGFAFGSIAPTVGGRYGLPILKNGFIRSLDNSVSITFGVDVSTTLRVFGVGIGIPVTVAWNFYFNEQFSAFADAGINLYFNTNYLGAGEFKLPVNDFFMVGFGGRYHLNEKLALLARVGSPYAAIGIEFQL